MKLRCVGLIRYGLKGVKIFQNVAKICLHACLSNRNPNLWSSFNSEKLVKVKIHRAVLLGFGLKVLKIALNIVKVGVYSYLSNQHPNLWSNFNSEKLGSSEPLSWIFARVGLKGSPNSSKHGKSRRARLYIKQASKSMIKFQFREFDQKWNSIMGFR